MKISDFDYNLPKGLIASSHAEPRDHSRLLVVNRSLGCARDEQARSRQIEHKHFYDILDFLKKGDILVFNNSKVFKARIFGKKETGGKVELLLVRPIDGFSWEALARGKIKVGDKIIFENKLFGEIKEKNEKVCIVKFNFDTEKVFKYLGKYGEMPLPPYIHPVKPPVNRRAEQFDGVKNFYQTVYADKVGSVAAPTAGFHFTPELIKKIKAKGVKCLDITLHVGPGTFLPVETENVKNHKMHEEFFEVKKEVWNEIISAKSVEANGCSPRIIAVGTTTARVLEHLGTACRAPTNKTIIGSTDIFIYPPYDFKVVDCLITNFHLPKSTLLMLVSAFLAPNKKSGIKLAKKVYQEAIKKKYRFYSFGDSMFIQ
ncbi:MAG: tRNA preQ1(34) S-adenosylmethionine ribosyltransferase-isomerase QueA [Patescibacteria group bacterium]|nr:tRNA preQ1(34) S-adenosylmethionine ribosyltransferase-isomerase QueA [Patescibacteria group bacterium]